MKRNENSGIGKRNGGEAGNRTQNLFHACSMLRKRHTTRPHPRMSQATLHAWMEDLGQKMTQVCERVDAKLNVEENFDDED